MRERLTIVCLTLTLAGLARPADARMLELLDWLQELSGPGEYYGLGIEWEFTCFAVPLITNPDMAVSDERASSRAARMNTASTCYNVDKNRVQRHFSVASGILEKKGNPYHQGTPDDGPSTKVTAVPASFSFDTTLPGLEDIDREAGGVRAKLGRLLEVGVAVGSVRYSGQGFDPVWVSRFQTRVTLKAGFWTDENHWSDAISGRVGWQRLGSIRPDEFGASPPTAETGSHNSPFATLMIDVETLFKRLKN